MFRHINTVWISHLWFLFLRKSNLFQFFRFVKPRFGMNINIIQLNILWRWTKKNCAAVEMRENQWKIWLSLFALHELKLFNWTGVVVVFTIRWWFAAHMDLFEQFKCMRQPMHFYSANRLSTFGMAKTHLMANNKANTREEMEREQKRLTDVMKWTNIRQNDFTFHFPLKRYRECSMHKQWNDWFWYIFHSFVVCDGSTSMLGKSG